MIAILGILVAGVAGCKHTCGKCDCSAAPGEATLYAPMQGYPVSPATPGVMPGRPVEVIGAPK